MSTVTAPAARPITIDNALRRKLQERKRNNTKRPYKLTHDQVHQILIQYADGARVVDLAHEFGVSQTCIRFHVDKALA